MPTYMQELEQKWQDEMARMNARATLERVCKTPLASTMASCVPSCATPSSYFTPYQLSTIAGRFFSAWKASTGLESLPKGEETCELPVATVEPLLIALLPGLELHPYMVGRLLVPSPFSSPSRKYNLATAFLVQKIHCTHGLGFTLQF